MAVIKRGSHYAVVLTYRDEEGKKRQKWIKAGDIREVAEKLERKLRCRQDEGRLKPGKGHTVSSFFSQWIENVVKPQKRPATTTNYKDLLTPFEKRYGTIQLDKIEPPMVQEHINHELGRGLKPTSVFMQCSIVKQALAYAVECGYIVKNPIRKKAVTVPEKNKPKQTPLNLTQTKALETIIAHTDIALPITIGVWVGLRNGEVCGLRWEDIDEKKKMAYIRHSLDWMSEIDAERLSKDPDERKRVVWYGCRTHRGNVLVLGPAKTDASVDSVGLDDEVVAKIVQEKRLQAQRRQELGSAYKNFGFVFAKEDGQPHAPDSLYSKLTRAIAKYNKSVDKHNDNSTHKKEKLPVIKVHDLRHTAATMLLRAGVDYKTAARQIRHKRVAFFMDAYQHVDEGMLQESMEKINALKKKLSEP